MIPVSLTIKGLYSYKEAQTIDFAALISSGLFGIFGAVGSGKSSILEAIMFVLFEKSDRLNAKNDNRYYNMLNLQSDEMMLDFTFKAGNQNIDLYRFRFSARRNKKDFEKVEPKERAIYKWEGESWLPMEGVDAQSILGMSYQNFMQTIIIPQGKFREFVDHSASERTKMLKELFHLDKFDLSAKSNVLISQNKENIDKLQGRLEELADVDAEQIELKEQELDKKLALLHEAELQCDALKAENERLKLLQSLFLKIKELEEKLFLLKSREAGFVKKEEKVKSYESAYIYFREKIARRESLSKENKRIAETIENLNFRINANRLKLKESEAKLAEAKAAFDKRDEIKTTCEDLAAIVKIRVVNENLMQLKASFLKDQKIEESATELYNQLKNKISEKEEAIYLMEEKLPNVSELQKVYFWFQKHDDLEKEYIRRKEIFEKHKGQLATLEQEKVKIFSNGRAHLSPEEIAGLVKKENEDIETKIDLVNRELHSLMVQQKIADFSENLKDGEACPLCGSLHHPSIVSIHNVEDKVKVSQEKLNELEALKKSLRLQESQLQELQLKFKNQGYLVKEKLSECSEVETKLQSHLSAFSWVEYSIDNPEIVKKKINEAEIQSKLILEAKNELKNLKEDFVKKESLLLKLKENIQKLGNEIYGEERTVDALKGQLKQLSYEKYEKYDTKQLQDSLSKGEKRLLAIEKEYDNAVLDYQNDVNEEQRLSQEITIRNEALAQQTENLHILDKEIQQLLQEKEFESIEKVKEILSAALDIDREKMEIEAFARDLHSTKTALSKYQEEAAGIHYDEKNHHEKNEQLAAVENQVKELKKATDVLEHELLRLRRRHESKNDCIKELEKLQLREQNLKELRRLFMGNGFVRYVSNIYLNDLCKAANQRFFKLTNNNLSLELNQEEEFIVRDYLNNGKTRLLKTLSGGQTFQAALCLALALAENVKSLNKAEQSFFFLDEGFGSLDKDSLRVVFDTLKTLRKENRIVGIISHVEELQQEIDVYLRVRNDKERGSVVEYSWQ